MDKRHATPQTRQARQAPTQYNAIFSGIKCVACVVALVSLSLTTVAQQTTSYTYNDAGLVLTIDGPRTDVSDVISYTYDEQHNRTSITNALGHVITLSNYDARGQAQRIVDANNVETLLSYHPRGWLASSSIVHPSGDTTRNLVTTYTYDAVGQLVGVTLPDGSALTYEYDAARRLTGVSNSLGDTITYTLDNAGNRTKEVITDNGGAIKYTMSRAFDELSRVMNIIGAEAQTTHLDYDVNNNNTAVTNPREYTTEQEYDSLNRLTQIIDPDDGVTKYEYDAMDQLVAVTDANGNVTRYDYDAFGNLLHIISPDTGTTTYTYDNANNRLSETNARGVITQYRYDALNRLTHIEFPASPQENVTYQYDTASNGNYGVGRLTHMSDESGSIAYRYDHLGNLIEKSYTIAGQAYVVSYAYDAYGRMNKVVYPSGRIINYSVDSIGRISAVSLQADADATAQPLISGLAYLPFGPATGFNHANGISETWSYDLDYRLTSLIVAGENRVLSRTYDYDANSNIIDIDEANQAFIDQLFAYDALDRLDTASGQYGTISYDYDPVGNRLERQIEKDSDLTVETYSPIAQSNRLSRVDTATNNQSQARIFSYDPAGNLVSETVGGQTIEIAYNAMNRPKTWTRGSQRVVYTHNALGQRTAVTTSAGATHFHYSESGQLVAETNSTGTVQREYIYANGRMIAVVISDSTAASGFAVYSVHNDHLATPQAITDGNQDVVWQVAEQTPFGEVAVDDDPDGDGNGFVFNVRFPGQYWDEETQTSYNYFRDYDPSLGRYIQSDPIGLHGGLNTYAYVGGNPMMYIDPYGLWANVAVGVGIRVIGGRAAGAAISRALQQSVGPVAGTALACILTGYCSEEADDPADSADEGGLCPPEGESNQRGNPFNGEPGEWVEHPHGKQDRLYGNDGTPAVDIDYGHDHGQGSPHSHNWNDGVRGPGVPVTVIK